MTRSSGRPFFCRVTEGISRTVFLVGPYAIKVPCGRYGWEKWLRGLLANMQERRFGRLGWEGVCPVLLADPLGLVVVMPRCRPVPGYFTDSYYERLINRGDYRIPAENKPDSWGILNGKTVAVDYGN